MMIRTSQTSPLQLHILKIILNFEVTKSIVDPDSNVERNLSMKGLISNTLFINT